jgi:hypothetical protein
VKILKDEDSPAVANISYIIVGQSSPVSILSRISIAFPKFAKFMYIGSTT